MSGKLSLPVLLKKGNILHFDKFDFFDGADRKGRLLIVIQEEKDGKVVVATVTGTYNIPAEHMKPQCIKPKDKPYRAYHFPKNQVVGTTKNYFFDINCVVHLYVNPSVFTREIAYIKSEYHDKGNIQYRDTLTDKEYLELIYCIYHGPYVKRGVKKYLESELERLNK